jgi:hypothetical protein
VVFPDLPGCTAMGRTLDEALQHAMEAASEWAQAVSLPRPRLLEALRDDRESGTRGRRWRLASSRSSVANPVGANISHHSRRRCQRSARERPHMYAVLTFN